MFTAVQSSKAPQQIIYQIRSSILKGKLKPGEKLASEAELMEKFGVSKSTLREALRALEYLSLIEIRKGANGGPFVAEVDMEITKENLMNFLYLKNLSIKNISAIRKNLEPYAAKTAAETISEEDLEKLKTINELCRSAVLNGDPDLFGRNEINFHRIIANATKNPILILILDFIENLLENVKKILEPDVEFLRGVVESHERIYHALYNRDPDRASREMLKDVSKVEKGLARLAKGKKIEAINLI